MGMAPKPPLTATAATPVRLDLIIHHNLAARGGPAHWRRVGRALQSLDSLSAKDSADHHLQCPMDAASGNGGALGSFLARAVMDVLYEDTVNVRHSHGNTYTHMRDGVQY